MTTRATRFHATASQTVGPYYHFGLPEIPILPSDDIPGERITLAGQVLDGNGDFINDCMLEIWQANNRGKYDHPEDDQDKQTTPGFKGFGRQFVNPEGRFEWITLKPGPVAWMTSGQQAPHINVSVFARGVLKRMATRVYLGDDPGLGDDPVLNLVGDAARRETLIAKPDPGTPGRYTWNITLQGEGETVFLDI